MGSEIFQVQERERTWCITLSDTLLNPWGKAIQVTLLRYRDNRGTWKRIVVLRQTRTVGTVGTVGTSGTIGESVETASGSAHAWFHLVRRDDGLTWTLGREPSRTLALQGIDKLFPTFNFLMGTLHLHDLDNFPARDID